AGLGSPCRWRLGAGALLLLENGVETVDLLDSLAMLRMCLAPQVALCRRRREGRLPRSLRLLDLIVFGVMGVHELPLELVRIGLELLDFVWTRALIVHVFSSLPMPPSLVQFLGRVGQSSVPDLGVAIFARFLGNLAASFGGALTAGPQFSGTGNELPFLAADRAALVDGAAAGPQNNGPVFSDMAYLWGFYAEGLLDIL
ncbi:unnamed protein product, partial [Prorocentrum cordatum]